MVEYEWKRSWDRIGRLDEFLGGGRDNWDHDRMIIKAINKMVTCNFLSMFLILIESIQIGKLFERQPFFFIRTENFVFHEILMEKLKRRVNHNKTFKLKHGSSSYLSSIISLHNHFTLLITRYQVCVNDNDLHGVAISNNNFASFTENIQIL